LSETEASNRSAAIEAVWGRIVDVDAHVMLPPDAYPAILGDEFGVPMRQWAAERVAGLERDVLEAVRAGAREDVFRVKGFVAHGADDPDDRVDALDRMGIARQIVFPPVPLAVLHAAGPAARLARSRWNDAMCDWTAGSRGRLIPAMQLGLGDVDEAVEDTERLIATGARAVEIPFAQPPAGRSPAHPDWDQLWQMLADGGVTVLLHIGGGGLGGGFPSSRSFSDPRWGAVDRLRSEPGGDAPTGSSDPGSFTALGPIDRVIRHHPAETFVSALVLGGILERAPDLSIGIIELGAGWVGSWVEQLDTAAAAMHGGGLTPLPEPPSTYLRRQVRVTPSYLEPVNRYLARSHLDEIYAFSTDYPHYEGGKDPLGWSERALADTDDGTYERWFVTNGSRLVTSRPGHS
jgi:predicted TIM-barrel fold metal-dependent hydrolase